MKHVLLRLALCGAVLFPAIAFPCGGFFCSSGGGPPPVVQTGEKILFSFDNGEVTAHIQILYSGEARAFAWVVPVPAEPTLSVGSDQLFALLDKGTQPTFNVQWQNFCRPPPSLGCGCASPSVLDRSQGGAEDAGSGVTVVSRGPVGPFDTAVLASADPKALEKWLTGNGYDVGPAAQLMIAPYVAKGDFFVALKLLPQKGVGDLQPIVLKFASTAGPCVPIRLTAIAAQPDLGIAVFLLGDGRGVPTNYLHLVINESRLDWTGSPTVSYPLVVGAAADEAGGQGFITDFAGPSSGVQAAVDGVLNGYRRDAVATTSPIAFVKAVRDANLVGASQNVLGILGHCVPQPASVGSTAVQFYSNIETYQNDLTQTTVEQPRCGDEIDSLVIAPLRLASAALGKLPTLTRLYTTLSADEMTLDPEFAFNKDLPMVSAARSIRGAMICDGATPVRADLTGTDGRRFSIPWNGTNKMAPALLRAEHLAATGMPVIAIDNAKAVDASDKRSITGCGCIAGGSGAVVLGICLLLLAARRRVWA